MATKIEWTDMSWNPVTGCTPISSGCERCYAKSFALRLKGKGIPKYAAGFDVVCHPNLLDKPAKWRKPRRVFVNSMSDLFHTDVPTDFILKVFASMGRYQKHTFQVLTKRAERLLELNDKLVWYPNIWMGVTVEEDTFSYRAQLLKQTGANVKFVSVEPLVGPVSSLDVHGLDWVIVGGEKGAGARPMLEEWIWPIWRDAVYAEIPFFFKQWGSKGPKEDNDMYAGCVRQEFPA